MTKIHVVLITNSSHICAFDW